MNNFGFLIRQGLSSVWKNRNMSFASFCILTVSMLIVGLSALTLIDCGIILDNISDKNEISVFMEDDADIAHIKDVLQSNDLVSNVTYISPEDGLKEFMERYEDQKQLFESLPFNPVPPTYKVSINNLEKIDSAVQQFSVIDGVYKVSAPLDFASFIKDLRNGLTIVGLVLLVALGTVCVIIISNTTRLSVFSRRKEIAIMRCVGATNAFVKTPFFVEGLFIGLVSGGAAWFITKLGYEAIYSALSNSLGTLQVLGLGHIMPFESVTWIALGIYCFVGAFLAALGTVFSTGKYLKG